MSLLGLVLLSVLHFEAANGAERFSVYYRPGHEAFLPCSTVSPLFTSCSNIDWLYSRNRDATIFEFENGNMKNSVRSDRLSLTTNCSLLIHDVRAEDVGFYTCRRGRDTDDFSHTYLNVLIISPSTPDDDPNNGGVTLTCSLKRYDGHRPCRENSLRWLDETGAELLGEGVEHKFTNCLSVVSVKRQSDNNRRFTCQFVDEKNDVRIEAVYTPEPTDGNQTAVIAGAVVGGVVVLIVIAALIKYKCKKTPTVAEVPHVQKPAQPPDERELDLTYVTVSHDNLKASEQKANDNDVVTYSAVRTRVKTEADGDGNDLYGRVG